MHIVIILSRSLLLDYSLENRTTAAKSELGMKYVFH
jgi:hypothetical protein